MRSIQKALSLKSPVGQILNFRKISTSIKMYFNKFFGSECESSSSIVSQCSMYFKSIRVFHEILMQLYHTHYNVFEACLLLLDTKATLTHILVFFLPEEIYIRHFDIFF